MTFPYAFDSCYYVALVVSDSVRPHKMAAHQASPSLEYSDKNTGVGCRFLLQCMKVKSESEAAQSCLTLSDPIDCSLPGSSVHGIFQARVLEWVAIAFPIPVIDLSAYLSVSLSQAGASVIHVCTPAPSMMVVPLYLLSRYG